ncbi:MAG: hypothetical protein HYU86_12895 [Chloroflexi bacterium]|nr:hypothetical protein [Chloroflexota bacterium]
MKKLVGLVAGLALVALVLGVGTTFAQPPTPTQTGAPNGWAGHHLLDTVTLNRIATLLGTTVSDLTQQLQGGKTLLGIAQSKGVSESTLINTILEPFKDQIQLSVKYGYLTQTQADEAITEAIETIKELLAQPIQSNTSWGNCPMHGGLGGGMMGGGMMGGGGTGMMGGGYGMMGGGMMGGYGTGMMEGSGYGMMGGYGQRTGFWPMGLWQ